MQNLITKNQASKFWSYCSKCPPKKCNLQTPLEQWLKSKEVFLYFWNMSACERNPNSCSFQDAFSALLFCWHWLHFSTTISMPIFILTNACICIHYLQPESRHVLTVNPTKLPNISNDYAKLWRAWLMCVGVSENAYRLIQHVFWALINPMQIICKHNTNNFQQFDGHHLPQKTEIGWCCCDRYQWLQTFICRVLENQQAPRHQSYWKCRRFFSSLRSCVLLLVNPWNFVTISIMKVQVKTFLLPTNPCILLPAEWWNCKWKNPSFTVSWHSPISSSETLLFIPDYSLLPTVSMRVFLVEYNITQHGSLSTMSVART